MSPGISIRLLATQSDERLLALVRDGHERAFETLVHRYRRPLLGYCRRLSIPEARIEDVLQQSLLKAWLALRGGAEVRDLKAWLYRVVHNTALNAVRDAAHERERLADPTLRLGPAPADPERGLVMREALAEVAALPELQREVIVRTAVGGDSHEQVATDLGITDGAVRGLLYRARVTLRTAVTALTPPPLLTWLAGRAEQSSGPAPERLGELAVGGGAAGLGGLVAKGGIAALTAGTLLTGAAVVHLQATHSHRTSPHIAAAASTDTGGAGNGAGVAGAVTADASGNASGAARVGTRTQSGRRPRWGTSAGAEGAGGGSRSGHGLSSSSPASNAGGVTPVGSGGGSGEHTTSQLVPSQHVSSDTGGGGGSEAGQGGAGGGGTGGSAGSGSGANSGASGSSESNSGTGGSSNEGTGGTGDSGGSSGSGSGGSSGSSGGSSQSEDSSTEGSGSAGSGDSGSSGSGSGSSGDGGSGSQGGSSGSGSSGGDSESGGQSTGIVGAVVHEVGGLVEHLLH